MVIERFKNGDAVAVGERFARSGRLLPDGAKYVGSWMDSAGNRCFQVMGAASREVLDAWTGQWDDLVEFEIVPLEDPALFWAKLSD